LKNLVNKWKDALRLRSRQTKDLKEKFITTNELANDASKILRELKNGEAKVVLRYSDPVGVLVSYDDYKKMQNREAKQVMECKSCIGAIKRSK
jgi:prevent-host-death family protein